MNSWNGWVFQSNGRGRHLWNIFKALYLSIFSPLRPTLGGCSVIPALDTLIQSRSQLWGRLDALQLKIWLQSTWPPLQQLRPRQTVIIDFQHFQFEIVWYLRKMAVHFTENRLHKSDYINQHLKFQPSTSRCRRRPYTTRQTLSNCAGRFPGLATNSLFISVFFFFC